METLNQLSVSDCKTRVSRSLGFTILYPSHSRLHCLQTEKLSPNLTQTIFCTRVANPFRCYLFWQQAISKYVKYSSFIIFLFIFSCVWSWETSTLWWLLLLQPLAAHLLDVCTRQKRWVITLPAYTRPSCVSKASYQPKRKGNKLRLRSARLLKRDWVWTI